MPLLTEVPSSKGRQTDMCNPTDAIASKNGVDTFVRQNLKSTQEVSLLTTYNLRTEGVYVNASYYLVQ